jgi:hypothetical protein
MISCRINQSDHMRCDDGLGGIYLGILWSLLVFSTDVVSFSRSINPLIPHPHADTAAALCFSLGFCSEFPSQRSCSGHTAGTGPICVIGSVGKESWESSFDPVRVRRPESRGRGFRGRTKTNNPLVGGKYFYPLHHARMYIGRCHRCTRYSVHSWTTSTPSVNWGCRTSSSPSDPVIHERDRSLYVDASPPSHSLSPHSHPIRFMPSQS